MSAVSEEGQKSARAQYLAAFADGTEVKFSLLLIFFSIFTPIWHSSNNSSILLNSFFCLP